MPITSEIKKSSVNRTARHGTGITGLTLELQLVHLQNMAILRDRIKKSLVDFNQPDIQTELMKSSGSLHSEIVILSGLLEEANTIFDFIVQKDFESPLAKDLYGYDPEDRIPTRSKF